MLTRRALLNDEKKKKMRDGAGAGAGFFSEATVREGHQGGRDLRSRSRVII